MGEVANTVGGDPPEGATTSIGDAGPALPTPAGDDQRTIRMTRRLVRRELILGGLALTVAAAAAALALVGENRASHGRNNAPDATIPSAQSEP